MLLCWYEEEPGCRLPRLRCPKHERCPERCLSVSSYQVFSCATALRLLRTELLELSAAFDQIDHNIQAMSLYLLEKWVALAGTALERILLTNQGMLCVCRQRQAGIWADEICVWNPPRLHSGDLFCLHWLRLLNRTEQVIIAKLTTKQKTANPFSS